MADAERCVSCGGIIPEGRLVCPVCEMRSKSSNATVEDKLNLFLEEVEKQGIEITGETAFMCNDGAVLMVPNERGAVDIVVVRNPVKLDYTLGITDKDIELWTTTEELMQELGGE